jgi:hypothetical protein
LRRNPNQEGKGMAIAGLTIGIASLIIGSFLLLLSMITPFWTEFWNQFWISFKEEFYDNNIRY